MKAYQWAERFRQAEGFDAKVNVVDAFLDETYALVAKRKNESAIREQRQKWRAMEIYDVEVFDTALEMTRQGGNRVSDQKFMSMLQELFA